MHTVYPHVREIQLPHSLARFNRGGRLLGHPSYQPLQPFLVQKHANRGEVFSLNLHFPFHVLWTLWSLPLYLVSGDPERVDQISQLQHLRRLDLGVFSDNPPQPFHLYVDFLPLFSQSCLQQILLHQV